jgi:hypothetical protein
MDLSRLQALETIDPRPQPPWQTPAFVEIDTKPDHEKAKAKALIRQESNWHRSLLGCIRSTQLPWSRSGSPGPGPQSHPVP